MTNCRAMILLLFKSLKEKNKKKALPVQLTYRLTLVEMNVQSVYLFNRTAVIFNRAYQYV